MKLEEHDGVCTNDCDTCSRNFNILKAEVERLKDVVRKELEVIIALNPREP